MAIGRTVSSSGFDLGSYTGGNTGITGGMFPSGGVQPAPTPTTSTGGYNAQEAWWNFAKSTMDSIKSRGSGSYGIGTGGVGTTQADKDKAAQYASSLGFDTWNEGSTVYYGYKPKSAVPTVSGGSTSASGTAPNLAPYYQKYGQAQVDAFLKNNPGDYGRIDSALTPLSGGGGSSSAPPSTPSSTGLANAAAIGMGGAGAKVPVEPPVTSGAGDGGAGSLDSGIDRIIGAAGGSGMPGVNGLLRAGLGQRNRPTDSYVLQGRKVY